MGPVGRIRLGTTFYVVRNREGDFSAVQVPPDDSEILASVLPPTSIHDRGLGRDIDLPQSTRGFVTTQREKRPMFKRLLGGAVGTALLAGLAWAQTYPPPTTPPEIPAPSIRVPAPGTSTTTEAPSLYGGWQATTTRQGLDEHGNPVTQRDIYREGIAGSSGTHETFTTDPRAGGKTFQSTTTHDPR